MNTVYGLDYYQNVRYGLVNDDGGTGIEVELDERSWGPNYLQLGMEFSSAANSDSLFGLAASYLSTAINPLGGEWRATVVIGDEPALIADLYQPFGPKGLYFYAPSLIFESTQFNVYEGDERVTEAQLREATLEFAVGRELPTWGEYRFGLRAAKGAFDLRVGDPTLHLRGGVPARRVLRPLLGRHDGQRLVSARTGRSRRSNGGRRASGCSQADADFDQLLVSRARTRRPGAGTRCSRRCATTPRSAARRPTAGCSAWAASSTSRASTATSSRASTRRAWARATTGASATSRCSRRSPA